MSSPRRGLPAVYGMEMLGGRSRTPPSGPGNARAQQSVVRRLVVSEPVIFLRQGPYRMHESQLGEDRARGRDALLRPVRAEMFAVPAFRELENRSDRLDVAPRNPM